MKIVTANAHGTKEFVQISESSNYRVFKLTAVDCTTHSSPGVDQGLCQFNKGSQILQQRCNFMQLMKLNFEGRGVWQN